MCAGHVDLLPHQRSHVLNCVTSAAARRLGSWIWRCSVSLPGESTRAGSGTFSSHVLQQESCSSTLVPKKLRMTQSDSSPCSLESADGLVATYFRWTLPLVSVGWSSVLLLAPICQRSVRRSLRCCASSRHDRAQDPT